MKRKGAVRGRSIEDGRWDPRVATFMPLIPAIAEQVQRQLARRLDLGKLAKDGLSGLIKATKLSARQSRAPFRVYAKQQIRGAILDSIGLEVASPVLRPSASKQISSHSPTWLGARGAKTEEHDRGTHFSYRCWDCSDPRNTSIMPI